MNDSETAVVRSRDRTSLLLRKDSNPMLFNWFWRLFSQILSLLRLYLKTRFEWNSYNQTLTCSKPPNISVVSIAELTEMECSVRPQSCASVWTTLVLPLAVPPTTTLSQLWRTHAASERKAGSWPRSTSRSLARSVQPISDWKP